MRGRILRRRLLPVAGAAVALLVVASMAAAALVPFGTIVFVSNRDYQPSPGSDVYVMDSDGSGLIRLTTTSTVENDPVLSPDGTKLAYEVAGHIWVRDLGTDDDPVDLLAGCVNQTNDPCGYAMQPAWSPDSTKIAFAFRWPRGIGLDIKSIVDQSRTHVFVPYEWIYAQYPTWSPDGTKLAFTLFASGTSSVRTALATTYGQQEWLANGKMPAWSPDGNWIAFVDEHVEAWPGYDPIDYGDDIALVPACDDCQHNPMWLSPAEGRDWNPSWSGDGTSILFQSERWTSTPASTDAEAVFHLWAVDAFPWDNDPNISDDYGYLDLTLLSAASGPDAPGSITYSDTMASWHWPVYDISGFFAPVRGYLSVKAGAAVPIKFSLGGDQGLDIFMDGFPRTISRSCGIVEGGDLIPTVTAGATSLTYDPVEDQYIYIWKTDKKLKGCREFQIAFKDGTFLTADVSLW